VYLLLCFVIVQAGAEFVCRAPGPASDPSGEVVGELTWRWLPPAAECAWAVDEHGAATGVPTVGAATRTHRFGGVFGSWDIAALVIVAVVSLTAASVPTKRRGDAVESHEAVGT
jgi:hypothetical protein